MAQIFTNNAKSKLLTSISSTATSVTIQPGTQSLFPTLVDMDDWFICTIEDDSLFEIVKVTATISNTYTIERAQEGTIARDWAAGALFELRLTAGGIQKIQSDISGGIADALTFANTGAGEGVFRSKVGDDVTFKSLTAGSNVTLTPSADEIEISVTPGTTLPNLTVTGESWLGGVAGAESLNVPSVPSAVNHVEILGSTSGNDVKINAEGDSTNIGIDYTSKGIGKHTFNVNAIDQLEIDSSGVHILQAISDSENSNKAASTSFVKNNLNFIQSGTGAVGRTIHDKLRDIISVKDFGAVGDGVTDDSAAFLASHNSAGSTAFILVPSGIYLIDSSVTVTGRYFLLDGGTIINSSNLTGANVVALSTFAKSGVNSDITSLTAANLTLTQLLSINGGQIAGRRNKIINGAFDVWQLGSSINITGHLQKTADRWNYDYNGTIGTLNISKSILGPNNWPFTNGPSFKQCALNHVSCANW